MIVGNAYIPHASQYGVSGEECQGVTLTLDPAILHEWLAEFDYVDLNRSESLVFLGKVEVSDLMHHVMRLKWEANEQMRGYRLLLEGLARQLVADVFRRWPQQLISFRPKPQFHRQLPRHQFVKAVEYMNSCSKAEFRLPNLCGEVGSSVSRFTQRFWGSTRSKPLPFYNRLIVEKAKRHLATPGRSVKDVSYGLGFRSVSHFCSLFKGVAGVSPQEYLQQRQCILRGTGTPGQYLSNKFEV